MKDGWLAHVGWSSSLARSWRGTSFRDASSERLAAMLVTLHMGVASLVVVALSFGRV